MAHAAELSFRTVGTVDLVIVSPNDPAAMTQYAEECRTLGIRYIFDPGQQCARMSGPELADGINGAYLVICNDYELELIREKTGLGEADILQRAEHLVVTRGEHGSSVLRRQRTRADVPAVTPHRIADPTGVGDAYRGGFMKGLAHRARPHDLRALGSVAATYALEHLGGTSHAYTLGRVHRRGTSSTSARSHCSRVMARFLVACVDSVAERCWRRAPAARIHTTAPVARRFGYLSAGVVCHQRPIGPFIPPA